MRVSYSDQVPGTSKVPGTISFGARDYGVVTVAVFDQADWVVLSNACTL